MPTLAELTERFTHFCRTGECHPSLENIPRLDVYYDLIQHNFEDTLRRAYPLTHHLLKPDEWNELVQAYMAQEASRSPFLWRMPERLGQFVQKNEWDKRLHIPYLTDLVAFEWLEIEIFMMPDAPLKSMDKEQLYLNPESRIVSYSYPVFEKKPLPRSMKEGTYPLLGFRHPENGSVYFIALSAFFQTILELLQEPRTGLEVIREAAEKWGLNQERALVAGEKFLADLIQQRAITVALMAK